MTLHRYLTRLILLCVLPLLLLAAALAAWHVNDVEVEGRAEAQRLARSLAAAVDQTLSARIAGLHMLAMSPLADEPGRWAELHREAQGFVAAFGSHVAVVDAALQPRLHTRVPLGGTLPTLPNESVRRAVERALASRAPAISDPFLGILSQENAVALVVPGVREGRANFVVINSLPYRLMAGLLDRLVLPAGWRVTVSDGQARPIAWRGSDVPESSDDGWNIVERVGSANWSVQVHVPNAVRWQRLGPFAIGLALAVLGATAVAVFGGLLASRRLARSVHALVDPAAGQGAPPIAEIGRARRLLDEANDRLLVREAQLRGIVESATDAIITADASQLIVMANPAAARVFGRPHEQLIGLPLDALVPERFRLKHRQDVAAFGEGAVTSRAMAGRADVTGLHADGSEFPIEAAISQVHVDGQRLYTVILRDVTQRRRAEAALRASQAELEASHDELQRLIAAQRSIEENERRRIARELHDELQQVLAAIKMDAGAIESELAADPRRVAPLAARIDDLAGAAISSTRRIVNDLRPPLLEELGLVAALEALASQFTRRSAIEARVVTQGRVLADDELSSPVAICLYRIAQESLNNVAKHSGAKQVQISLVGLDDGGVQLHVHDDGRGIAEQDRRKPGSYGLRGMLERVRSLGGRLRVAARRDGAGTVVEVELPPAGTEQDESG